MSIPEDKIQQVRDATDIIEIISQYVTMKKRGKSFVGLCPFHSEKTPSFHVDPVRGFYHCFGCGAGGNVFSFVMQMERIGFPEAIKLLANKAGITLPEFANDDNRTKEIEELYQANQLAAEFYRKTLLETEEGKQAQTYFYSKRKFNPRVGELFQIGLAPNTWDGLIRKAEKASMKLEVLIKAGLIVPRKDKKGYYDRFRGRLMFPIHNPSGKIVGFGGRILRNDPAVPKYLNSPETAIYQKSRILYGLYQSKTGIQRENKILLVEGYTDLMRMVSCGLDFTAATSGTALTEGHAALLSRYARNAVLVFDGDSAGFRAALRGVAILIGAGISVQVALLPKGTDPDTFLLQFGKSGMEKLIGSAVHFIDFYIDQMQGKGKLVTISDRAETARSILSVVSKIKDPIERNLMIKETGEKLGLDEKMLMNQLTLKPVGSFSASPSEVKNLSARVGAEEDILHLLVENSPQWAKPIFRFVNPSHFKKKEIQIVVSAIFYAFSQGNELNSNTILDLYRDSPEMIQFLTGLLSQDFEKQANLSQLALDCIIRLRQEEIQERIDIIKNEVKTLQHEGKDNIKLAQECLNIRKSFDKLKVEITEEWKKHVENV